MTVELNNEWFPPAIRHKSILLSAACPLEQSAADVFRL